MRLPTGIHAGVVTEGDGSVHACNHQWQLTRLDIFIDRSWRARKLVAHGAQAGELSDGERGSYCAVVDDTNDLLRVFARSGGVRADRP